MSISDASGDSAIFEYVGGKLSIYHGKQYKVMTNSPSFDKQLGLNGYWQEVDGKFLSGEVSGHFKPASPFTFSSASH